MSLRPAYLLLPLVCLLAPAISSAQSATPAKPEMRWVTTLTTGFADTFQLTLGGLFGGGPAWQSRMQSGLSNVWRAGDSAYVYGWHSFDAPSTISSYQAGAGYKLPVWKHGRQTLVLGSGVQYWRFPSVKTGANDWLIPGNMQYTTRIAGQGVIITSDSWSLLKSPLPTGSLLHTQGWLQHKVFKNDHVSVAFRHGPAQTYSWNFYGTNGNRVLRYQTMLNISCWAPTPLRAAIASSGASRPASRTTTSGSSPTRAPSPANRPSPAAAAPARLHRP